MGFLHAPYFIVSSVTSRSPGLHRFSSLFNPRVSELLSPRDPTGAYTVAAPPYACASRMRVSGAPRAEAYPFPPGAWLHTSLTNRSLLPGTYPCACSPNVCGPAHAHATHCPGLLARASLLTYLLTYLLSRSPRPRVRMPRWSSQASSQASSHLVEISTSLLGMVVMTTPVASVASVASTRTEEYEEYSTVRPLIVLAWLRAATRC